jgi:predicted DNA-binding transcriptional regulator YafY
VHLLDIDEIKEQWHFAANPSAAIDPAIFSIVMHAIGECATLEVDYFSARRMKETTRLLDPYGFAAPGGSWLLVAWCREHLAFRTFSVADIRRAEPSGSYFLRDDTFDIDRYFADHFGGVGGSTRHDVTLRVAADCVAAFRRKRYHPSQILEPQPDGTAIARFRVAGLEDIRAFVMSWGTGVAVTAPAELRAMVRVETVGMMREYGEE